LPYTFKVLNSKEVNALAVPGGTIYLFKGLVDYMPSDSELAGIIGHEVGHIVKKHTLAQIDRGLAAGVALTVLLGGSAGGAILSDLITGALLSSYSRDAEREADQLGVIHTIRAGYNPYSALISMEKLEAMSGKSSYGLFLPIRIRPIASKPCGIRLTMRSRCDRWSAKPENRRK